ncbi:efflux RND transporter periplasmic adaptor subunit [Thermoanaerobacterium thermosaccharolyticum]|uniref:efflux RND transporter periplasmic adaptor subunit n=1 Tax=Thermoanaerobacterium thermosaccharolyticum TaxID=1517 RepID=UPI003DA999D5
MWFNKLNTKKIILFTFVFTLSTSILSGCGNSKKTTSKAPQAVLVKATKAELNKIENYSTYTGVITSEEDIKVSSKISGKVKEVNFQVGSYVKEGDPLIVLDTNELNIQLAQAKASLDAAEANLAANEYGNLPQELEQAKTAYSQAESNYLNAKTNYDRVKSLYDAGATSKQSLDSAQLQYQTAESQYENAKEQLDIIQKKQPENLKALQSQVEQAQAQVELAETNVQNGIITAPISGVVTSKQIDAGEMCQAGTTLLTISNTNNVDVVINVPEDDINNLKVGQDALVSVDAINNGNNLKGKISEISPSSQQNGIFQVKTSLDNKDNLLKSGMFAKVSIVTEIKQNAITIPKDAIMIKKYGNTVYVVNNGKAEERLVKLGISNSDKVEVVSGIKAGETVIVSGQNMITEGTKVKIQ